MASWTYDTLAKGQLTNSKRYTGSTPGTPGLAYTESVGSYNDLYEPNSTTIAIPTGAPAFGGTSYTTSLYYFADGSPSAKVYPAMGGLSAETLRYAYDGLGLVGGLNGTSSYSLIDRTALGQVGDYHRLGTTDMYSTYSYDPATQAVVGIKDMTVVGSTYTTQADRVITRNNAGGITSVATTGTVTDTQCFAYDYLQDLTEAWTPANSNCATARSSSNIGGDGPYWTSYTVNTATGNRTGVTKNPTTVGGSSTSATYSYPAATAAYPHGVSSVTGTAGGAGSYGYDASGNTTGRPGQTLTFDQIGKLSTVTVGSLSVSNLYDASGTLLLQTDTTGSTLYLGETELRLASGASSASAVRTYALEGAPVAERTTTVGTSGSILRWLGIDQDGTPDLEVAVSAGTITHRLADPTATRAAARRPGRARTRS